MRREVVLVVAYGVLMLINSETRHKMYDPFNLKSVRNLLIAENTPSVAAFELDEEVEAKIGASHLIIETSSLGLIMRYILDHYFSIKLDFTDSFTISNNGVVEEFAFD